VPRQGDTKKARETEHGSSVIGWDKRKYSQLNRVGRGPKIQEGKKKKKSPCRRFAFSGIFLFTENSWEIRPEPCACTSIPWAGFQFK
jgi:hypothetical protein